jgi:mevalonate kinase
MPLVIALAGPPASTRSMVEGVARLRARRREIVDKAFEGIRALVTNARLCIEVGDLPGLGKLMDLNQMLLSGLMVSSESIERACEIARNAGALGAKLTGAGGGGAVVALADIDPDPVIEAFAAAGLSCFSAVVPATERGP